MGKVIKYKWMYFLTIMTLLIVVFCFTDYSNPRREIYFRYQNKLTPAFLFGYLPDKYNEFYEEEIVETSENYSLINIKYNLFPSENHNYILLKEKGILNSEEILFDSDSIFWKYGDTKNLLSSQINLIPFNKYLNYKEINGKQDITYLFCKLMTDFGFTDYKIVSTIVEISNLREIKSLNPNNLEYYIMLQENFTPDFDAYTYVWFDNLGLFEISIDLIDNKLKSIGDKFIFGPLSLSIGTEDY